MMRFYVLLVLVFISNSYAQNGSESFCIKIVSGISRGIPFEAFRKENLKFHSGSIVTKYSDLYKDLTLKHLQTSNGITHLPELQKQCEVKMADPHKDGAELESINNAFKDFAGSDELQNKEEFLVEFKCDSNLVECDQGSVLIGLNSFKNDLAPLSKMESTKMVPEYTPGQCECLKHDFGQKTPGVDEVRGIHDKLNKLIFEAAGKKVLNKYSANYEDVSFYLNNRADLILGDDNKKSSYNYSLLCNDPVAIKDEIKKTCGDNPEKLKSAEEHLSRIFDTAVKHVSGQTFENQLKKLGEEISSYSPEADNRVKKSGKKFSRTEYDKLRYSLGQEQPHVQIMNALLTGVIRTPDMGIEFHRAIKAGVAPHLALKAILQNPDYIKYLKTLFQMAGTIDIQYAKLWHETFIAPKTNKAVDEFFNLTFNYHPGLKQVLRDEEASLKLCDAVRASDSDALEVLEEKEKNILIDRFKSECDDIQANLAELACTPESDLIHKVDRAEINDILAKHHKELGVDPEALAYSVCQSPFQVSNSKSLFNNLTKNDRYGFSDYFDRLQTKPNKHQKNAFTQVYEQVNNSSENSKLNNYLNRVTTKYESQRVVAPMSFEVGERGRTDRIMGLAEDGITFGKKEMSSDASSTLSEGGKSQIQELSETLQKNISTKLENIQPANIVGATANTVNPTTTQISAPVATVTSNVSDPEIKEPKKEEISKTSLKQLLGPLDDEGENLLNQISEKDATEVLAMREKLKMQQDEISNLKLDAEKQKASVLKQKYEDLSREFEDMKGKYLKNYKSSEQVDYSPIKEEVKEIRGQVRPGNANGAYSSLPNDPNSIIQKVLAKEVSEVPRTQIKDIVIQGKQKTNDKDAKPDPSLDVISYLETNELGLIELKQLRDSGIVYRFETSEQKITFKMLDLKVQKQIEQKITQLEAEQELREQDKKTHLASRAYTIQALLLRLLTVEDGVNKKR